MVPVEKVEKEFWRLVSSLDDEVRRDTEETYA